jgi:hypothetical protein
MPLEQIDFFDHFHSEPVSCFETVVFLMYLIVLPDVCFDSVLDYFLHPFGNSCSHYQLFEDGVGLLMSLQLDCSFNRG